MRMQTDGFPLQRPRTKSGGERVGGPALRGRRRAGQTSTTRVDLNVLSLESVDIWF